MKLENLERVVELKDLRQDLNELLKAAESDNLKFITLQDKSEEDLAHLADYDSALGDVFTDVRSYLQDRTREEIAKIEAEILTL